MRGVSEAVSAVLLLAVVAAASYIALNGSTSNITDEQRSVLESIALKGAQLQELLAVISSGVSADSISVELLNYGTRNIIIDQAFADGVPVQFAVFDSDGNVFENNTIPPRKIMTIRLDWTGQAVQLLTDSKNIFKFAVG